MKNLIIILILSLIVSVSCKSIYKSKSVYYNTCKTYDGTRTYKDWNKLKPMQSKSKW
jgi:hypothetical protein